MVKRSKQKKHPEDRTIWIQSLNKVVYLTEVGRFCMRFIDVRNKPHEFSCDPPLFKKILDNFQKCLAVSELHNQVEASKNIDQDANPTLAVHEVEDFEVGIIEARPVLRLMLPIGGHIEIRFQRDAAQALAEGFEEVQESLRVRPESS